MKLSRKNLARTDWTRILARKSAHMVLKDGDFDGEAELIRIDELTAPLVKRYDDGTSCTIVDKGHYWLQLAPRKGYWWLTVMFDRDLRLSQYYFDLTAGSELVGNGESSFVDLFLDVVMTADGRLYLLDEDELEEAESEGLISSETSALTKERAAALMRAISGSEPQLQAFCRKYLELLLPRLA